MALDVKQQQPNVADYLKELCFFEREINYASVPKNPE
jgi:hypothetical protein